MRRNIQERTGETAPVSISGSKRPELPRIGAAKVSDDDPIHTDEWRVGLRMHLTTLNTKRVLRAQSPDEVILICARHNLRIGNGNHRHRSSIDAQRTALNTVLRGPSDPDQVAEAARRVLAEFGIVPLRADSIMGVELVFQPPPDWDLEDFYQECLRWCDMHYSYVISAIVHRDQKRPHMHVLCVPVQNGRLAGAELTSGERRLAAQRTSFVEYIKGQLQLKPKVPTAVGRPGPAAVSTQVGKFPTLIGAQVGNFPTTSCTDLMHMGQGQPHAPTSCTVADAQPHAPTSCTSAGAQPHAPTSCTSAGVRKFRTTSCTDLMHTGQGQPHAPTSCTDLILRRHQPPPMPTGTPDADRWCWPHSDAWNTAEIDTFSARTKLFIRRGVNTTNADDLAESLVLRDRAGSCWHLCLECEHLIGNVAQARRCRSARVPSVLAHAAGGQPGDLTTQRSQCPSFRGVDL